MVQRLKQFFKQESSGGVLLLIFALLAMLCANSPLRQFYFDFLDVHVSVQFGQFGLNKTFIHWVNDGFMAVFFILVGMEVKRELLEGSLSSYQQAIFPALAALGGMIVPAIVYALITYQHPEIANGWAIPMATDIAFAVGVVALLGKQVPVPLKVFLLALAIIDDLGAIIVIALFFSTGLSIKALAIACVAVAILVILNRLKVSHPCTYLVVGVILWAAVLKSGIHATIAGVIVGFCIPLYGNDGTRPLHEFEHIISPWCSFFILPLFAFANAGVYLGQVDFSMIFSPLPLGIALGLLVGKTLGVFSFSYLSIKIGIAKLPNKVNIKQIFAIAVLCGIGFTMSMFLAGLAFEGETDSVIHTLSRLGILMGSGISALLGYFLLKQATNNT